MLKYLVIIVIVLFSAYTAIYFFCVPNTNEPPQEEKKEVVQIIKKCEYKKLVGCDSRFANGPFSKIFEIYEMVPGYMMTTTYGEYSIGTYGSYHEIDSLKCVHYQLVVNMQDSLDMLKNKKCD